MTANVRHQNINRGIRFNTVLLSLVLGFGFGLGIFIFTHISVAVGGAQPGRYLGLLGVFFPGYSVTSAGAWVGFFWAYLYAGVSGAVLYQIYIRTSGSEPSKQVLSDIQNSGMLSRPTMSLSGNAFGIALGALMVLQLVLSTSWLVIRGTADESYHAALLGQYLPGYTVSILGSLIGAAWLFAYSYIMGRVIAIVYNLVTKAKANKRAL